MRVSMAWASSGLLRRASLPRAGVLSLAVRSYAVGAVRATRPDWLVNDLTGFINRL